MAQAVYNLGNKPSYRIGLDTSKTTNVYGGNVARGTGIELTTNERIPALDIQKLSE